MSFLKRTLSNIVRTSPKRETHAVEDRCSIRFAMGAFTDLRQRLLSDLENESFAVLLAKREVVGRLTVFNVVEARYPRTDEYERRSIASLGVRREYFYDLLIELSERVDVDSMIDVHTHPFAARSVHFSGVDDSDETRFSKFLYKYFDNDVGYASIVLSQTEYEARLWNLDARPYQVRATIKTVNRAECWPSSSSDTAVFGSVDPSGESMFDRSRDVIGLATLRAITAGETIVVVGAGGLGSAFAENLIHMGFHNLHLIDPDYVEVTNLNRIVGATFQDAEQRRPKVDVVANHLREINPAATISSHAVAVEHESIEAVFANASWIVIATDSHASRFTSHQTALRYFVPIVSVGVNITLVGDVVTDMSGEVILVRPGDGLCLNCLGRIDPLKIAAETHADPSVREGLVVRGYVAGATVKEPAVKTLNGVLAALGVEALINQYTGRQAHVPILVYENNAHPLIFADTDAVLRRNLRCSTCANFARVTQPLSKRDE